MGIAGLLFARMYIKRNSSPWFGRGSSLAKFPYTVVVGPVDAVKGIRGLVEIGMPRNRVTANIGPPLIEGMSTSDAERKGFIDPEDVSSDFFDGVFAWVQYDSQHEVMSLTFNLKAFRQQFGGNQKVLLTYRGRTYLLDTELTQNQVTAMFRADQEGPSVRVQGSELVIESTGTSLAFDDDGKHLQTVSLIAL